MSKVVEIPKSEAPLCQKAIWKGKFWKQCHLRARFRNIASGGVPLCLLHARMAGFFEERESDG